jgi:hypothetical protein
MERKWEWNAASMKANKNHMLTLKAAKPGYGFGGSKPKFQERD